MPSLPNFHASLSIPDGTIELDGTTFQPGPTAGGVIEDGDELMWVYVWIIQNGDEMPKPASGRAVDGAAADGESDDDETFTGKWEVQTEMTHDSDEFSDSTQELAQRWP